MKVKRKLGSSLSIIKLVNKYSGKAKWLLYIGILTTFINSIAYLLGGMVLPGLLVTKYFTEAIKQNIFNEPFFIWTVVGMAISLLIYGIFRYLEFKIYINLAYATATNMRKIAMEKILKMPVSYYDKNKSGDLISTLVNDVNNISMALSNILNQVFSNIAHVLITAIAMFIYSFAISAIVGSIMAVLFSLSILMIHKARPRVEIVWDSFANLNAFVEENIKNMKITKTFGRQEESTKNFKKIAKHIYKHALVADLYGQMFNPWFVMCTNISVLVAIVLTVVFNNNKLSILSLSGAQPDVGFVIAYMGMIFSVTGTLQTVTNTIFASQNGVVSAARVKELTEIETPAINPNELTLNNVKGHIKFNNVSFRYNKTSEQWQLKNASFEALPGQTIALVGPTGAGKTTIINLLSKFYEYEKGSITIDGTELKDIAQKSITDSMAVVLQDSFMFKGSVYDNILVGNPQATQEDIEKATKLVSAHDAILRLENGYQTLLENNDMLLSKGEKQLLAIARAILGNKKILILDEATSNIDSNTEQIIQEALANSIMKDKTSIVIAHRLSTIKNADLILFVEEGQIVEKGTHSELLKLDGKYATLYHSQFA